LNISINKKILLATHFDPVIHGQAMMAKQLLDVAKDWPDVDVIGLNTVYAEERGKLGKFSFTKIFRLFQYIIKIRKIIKTEDIDTIILCPSFLKGPFIKDAVVLWLIKKKLSVKVLGWVHMDPSRLNYESSTKLFRKVVDKTMREFDMLIACAPKLLDEWPDWVKRTGHLSVVTNGIPESGFLAKKPIKDQTNIMFLSAIDNAKGWREFVYAADLLCSDHDHLYFNLYGGIGANLTETEIQNQIESLPAANRIKWHGAVYGQDKVEAFHENHIFILPSYTEQFPIAILEAMSYGLVVLASDVGAVSDALKKDYLFSAKSVNSLREKLDKVLSNQKKLHEIGYENFIKYQKSFSDQRYSDSWYKLLSNSNCFLSNSNLKSFQKCAKE